MRKIILINQVANEKLPIFYSAARCLLFTPLYEIFGIALPEVIGCGCLIISTPIPAARDILNEANSIIVPFNDYQRLADAIESIFAEKIKFNREAIVKSSDPLKWDNIAKNYLVEFYNLLERKNNSK